MGSSDGRVASTTKIVNHRRDSVGWNLVIVGDGFQEAEMPAYEAAVDSLINALQTTAPFTGLWNLINVFRINVISTDSGADDPVACGGSGAMLRTFFDSSFCNNGIRRLLQADSGLALGVANGNVSAVHMVMVLVNSTVYGGSGGSIAVCSLDPSANEIAIHEMGHTAFGLADEYSSYRSCGDPDDNNNNYGIFEPSEANVTRNRSRESLKWRTFVDAITPIPTTSNANCAMCDPQANPLPATTVGLYEGSHYYHCGAFRPQFDCRMRSLGQPFCAVCQQRIRESFQCWVGQFECIQTRDNGYSRCTATRDQGYNRCTQTRDQGYNSCTQTRDQGYRDCCTWWPCSWLCSAWVWISNIVCVAWTWISNIVCVAWTWISNIVCIAWTWVSSIVCVAWRRLQCT